MPAQITPLSAPPTRADPINFPARADTFLSELPVLATEMNAVTLEVNANALAASAAKDIAILKRNEAVAAASAASDSATSASSSAAFASESARLLLGAKSAPPTVDNDGNPLLLGMRYYDTTAGKERVYGNTGWEDGISAVAGVSSFNGMTGAVEVPPASPVEMEAGTETNLRLMSPEGVRTAVLAAISTLSKQGIAYEARTSATPLVSEDATKWISFTSGSFTQTFTDAASLKAGWWIILDNRSSNDITLQPNGVETIDGMSSYIMYPGEVRLVQCDGTTLRTVVLKSFYRTFTTSGTFTKPPGYSAFQGLLWGGGGAGSEGNGVSAAGGGGGGACNAFCLPASVFAASETVTIGSGGAIKAAPGGTSSIGTKVFAYGGGGGGSASTGGGGSGGGVAGAGVAGAADARNGGEPQYASDAPNTMQYAGGGYSGGPGALGGPAYFGGGGGGGGVGTGAGANGGLSIYGGGGGGGGGSTMGGTAGTSVFGGSGGAGVTTGPAGAGQIPAGGGGSSRNGTGGHFGVGARGELRIWGII